MMGLTKRQSEALAFIRGFIEAKGYSPNYAEIAGALGYASKSKAHSIVHQLKERGAIELGANRARSIRIVEVA